MPSTTPAGVASTKGYIMKWFDKWFYKKAKWAWEHRDMPDDIVGSKYPSTYPNTKGLVLAEEPDVWSDGLRINVKKMIGGYVVTFRTYDRIRDRSEDRNYIITDEQDFNQELGKMITMESMRQTA
jgi:hypothetical protein